MRDLRLVQKYIYAGKVKSQGKVFPSLHQKKKLAPSNGKTKQLICNSRRKDKEQQVFWYGVLPAHRRLVEQAYYYKFELGCTKYMESYNSYHPAGK